jgi:hypothetical protein
MRSAPSSKDLTPFWLLAVVLLLTAFALWTHMRLDGLERQVNGMSAQMMQMKMDAAPKM